MLSKPSNWDTVQAKELGEFLKLPAGAYHCKITAVEAEHSKAGNEMLVLEFDIASGEFKGMFESSQYKPKYYQVTEGASVEYFKGMITAIEESNPGYTWDWTPINLVGKQCAVAFGDEEYLDSEGNLKVSTKPRWIRSVQALRDGKVPVPKMQGLKAGAKAAQPQAAVQEVHSFDDEDLPF